MNDQTKTFGQAVTAGLTSAAALQRHSTEESASAERRDRHFLQCIRMWDAMLPKRQGDDLGAELMVKGYQRMLGHLSETEMGWLTEMVLDKCKWFPTVAECKAIMAEQSYSNKFHTSSRRPEQIGSSEWWSAARLEAASHGRTLIGGPEPKAIGDGGSNG